MPSPSSSSGVHSTLPNRNNPAVYQHKRLAGQQPSCPTVASYLSAGEFGLAEEGTCALQEGIDGGIAGGLGGGEIRCGWGDEGAVEFDLCFGAGGTYDEFAARGQAEEQDV